MGRKKKAEKETHHKHKQEEELPLEVDFHQKQSAHGIELAEGNPTIDPARLKKKHHHKKQHHTSSPEQMSKQTEKCPHFTWQEIGKHDVKDDAWVVIQDNVYDVTKLISSHPGGPKAIEQRAGKDATKRFHKGHHPYRVVEQKLPQLMIGRVHMDSCIESWQREKRTGRMDLFCVVVLSLTLLGSLIYLATV